jgi:hypothetical protein
VKTRFGRAERVGSLTTIDDPISAPLSEDQQQRYSYPQVRVIMPGGPYFKWPWEQIRKVHFRDVGMIAQIESKVVNRLRQVTSAIKQDGANQVSIITSTAERQAAVEFAKAAAVRPQIVGEALQRISEDHEVAETLFEILETQKVIGSGARLTVLPPAGELRAQLIAGQAEPAGIV